MPHSLHSLAQELPCREGDWSRCPDPCHGPSGQIQAIPADLDVLALGPGSLDHNLRALHDVQIPYDEVVGGSYARVTAQAQGQLPEVVASDGEASEAAQEFLGQGNGTGQLSHHVHIRPILSHLVEISGGVQNVHEQDNDFRVRQARGDLHNLHGSLLDAQTLKEELFRVAAAASEANHRFLLTRLMLLAHGVLGIDGRSQGCHGPRRLVDVELFGARMSPHALIS